MSPFRFWVSMARCIVQKRDVVALGAGAFAFLLGCSAGEPKATESIATTRQGLSLGPGATSINGVNWYSADTLGAPFTGTADYDPAQSRFTLTSNGVGLGIGAATPPYGQLDGVRYVYRPWSEGDVEIVVRIVASSNSTSSKNVTAGLMIREGNRGLTLDPPNPSLPDLDVDDVMGGAWFANGAPHNPTLCNPATPGAISSFDTTSRRSPGPDGALVMSPGPGGTRVKPPLWLRLRRIGNDFAFAWRREDGPWVPMAGGQFTPTSEANVRVGFYVGKDWTTQGGVATATFDNVSVGPPQLEYRTSWLASSHAAWSTSMVSMGMDSYYVSPDGESYKYFADAEQGLPYGGHSIDKFDTSGNPLRTLQHGFFGVLQGAITGNGISGSAGRIYALTANNNTALQTAVYLQSFHASDLATASDFGGVSTKDLATDRAGGVAADANHIYVSDRKTGTSGKVRIFNSAGSEVGVIDDFAGGAPPGILAVDHRKRLWIARTADFPDPYAWNFTKNASSRIECRDPFPADSGGPCPAGAITGVDNPTALAVGPNVPLSAGPTVPTVPAPQNDKLFVALNGKDDQNVRIYTNLDTAPVPSGTFGVPKGVFAGTTPGLVSDPGTPGTRLFSPIGVGVDSSGNTYVASSAPRVEIQKYSSSGQPLWSKPLTGLSPEPGGFDPQNNDFYTLTRRFTLNLSANPLDDAPGSEWASKSVTWDPFRSDAPEDQRFMRGLPGGARFSPLIRYIPAGPTGRRFMFAQNGSVVRIFRFENGGNGEIAVPCGSIELATPNTVSLWLDLDGNGKRETTGSDRFQTAPRTWQVAFDVDLNGDLWFAGAAETNRVWKVANGGFNANGVPLYDFGSRQAYSSVPAIYAGMHSVRYDVASGALYIFGTKLSGQANWCGQGATTPVVARYANFGLANQTEQLFLMPDPVISRGQPYDFGSLLWDPECSCSEPSCFPPNPPLPPEDPNAFLNYKPCMGLTGCDCDWGYRSFAIAGDYFFVQERYGTIHVRKADDGAEVARIRSGPELSGWHSVPDYYNAVSVVRRSNGEYLLATTDTSRDSRTFLFRWMPGGLPRDLGETCSAASQCESGFCEQGVCCGNACVSSACVDANCAGPSPGTCWHTPRPDGTSCNDGNACTLGDSCQAGTCAGTSPAPGSASYCTSACTCAHGGGDCDSASECKPGLACLNDVGPGFGMSPDNSVCLPSTCGNTYLGSSTFCSSTCKCGHGGGDCDSSSECMSPYTCINDVGPAFGMSPTTDVCLPASCGTQALGSGSFCSGLCRCGYGGGDCDSASECLPGLTCIDNVGAGFGMSGGTDVCLPSACGANPLGSSNFCSATCPCGHGGGDCEPGQCLSGLVCGTDNGPQFGFSSTTDVCVPG